MIPLLNFLTPITNVIGSALWACDIERYSDEISHPRRYLLSPSPHLIEQAQSHYGTQSNLEEKPSFPSAPIESPPDYEQVIHNHLYPSAPIQTEKQ